MEVLRCPTPQAWLDVALGAFDEVLRDHAHCEKKAAASAMTLVASYPDHVELVRSMSKLAQEELRHFSQVHEIMVERGVVLGADPGDPYARALLGHVRHGTAETRRTDRLLVFSLIEARSCERLRLLSGGLEDERLAQFYGRLAGAEAGHHRLFVQLASRYEEETQVLGRLDALAGLEAQIIKELPLLPRIH